LSELSVGLEIRALPSTVRRRGAEVLAGALVTAARGAALPAVARVGSVMDVLVPGVGATVVGRPTPAAPYAAAFCNATACRAVGAHAGAAVVPAALAMAEVCGADPADLLAGVVAGLEVALRVGRALGDAHRAAGWDIDGTAGHVGAAVAAARVAQLAEEQTRSAMGIGATQAGGLAANHPTMAGACQVGKAAADGLEAAVMASEGIAGPLRPLEGRRGLLALASLVGRGGLAKLAFTGAPVDASTALALGLADEVVPEGTARAAAIRLAAQIADRPREVLIAAKQALRVATQPLFSQQWGTLGLLQETLEGGPAQRAMLARRGGAAQHA
jgi:hypothetical protein